MVRNLPEPIKSWLSLNEKNQIDYFFTTSDRKPELNDQIEDIGVKLRKAREVFLKGDWDYFLNVDDDGILEKDTLTKLLAHDKDVVSGLYQLRQYDSLNMRMLKDGEAYDPKWEEVKDLDLFECRYMSFGCMLVKRKVLEEVDFRRGEIEFSEDCWEKGFKMFCDPQIQIAHINIIYPDGRNL